jgi:hypothetical protein
MGVVENWKALFLNDRARFALRSKRRGLGQPDGKFMNSSDDCAVTLTDHV